MKKEFEKLQCRHCNKLFASVNFNKHQTACSTRGKLCLFCNKEFRADSKTQEYCSVVCSNRVKSRKPRKDNSYKTICFRYHEKKCIICEETNIVAVHHYDENHDNNAPSNLIPMCPTHHSYMHSSFRYLINNKVDNYIKDKILSLCISMAD